MTDWASNAVYADLTGNLAQYNGDATKSAPPSFALGFTPLGSVSAPQLNYLIDMLKDDLAGISNVPTSRLVSAGNGLTGGGSLAADRTLTALAADASISVGASGIKVGVLQSDAMHGVRGGGGLHTNATSSESGFMSAADKTAADALYTAYLARTWSVITTTATGTQNDWSPTGWDDADVILLNGASTLTVTGLAAPSSAGKWVKYFVRLNSISASFTTESASSTAANRIRGYASLKNIATARAAIVFAYARSATNPRWYQVTNVDAQV